MRKQKKYIKSGAHKIYIEFLYPKKTPAPAIIFAHGLRSYYTGFLDFFAKKLVENGYVAVKFHFLGTGKSDGNFEDKTTSVMLKNYKDVLNYVSTQKDVKGIGIVGRSNGAALAIIHGYDTRIKAYAFLAPVAFYSQLMGELVNGAQKQGKYFAHKSFKRPHTKGPGRLPITYVEELKQFDSRLLRNVKKIKRVIVLQSKNDEIGLYKNGHFEYLQKHLASPKKMVLYEGGSHSFKGLKKYVIAESILWFQKYLPIK